MPPRAFLRLLLLALLGFTAATGPASAQRNYAQEEYVILTLSGLAGWGRGLAPF